MVQARIHIGGALIALRDHMTSSHDHDVEMGFRGYVMFSFYISALLIILRRVLKGYSTIEIKCSTFYLLIYRDFQLNLITKT